MVKKLMVMFAAVALAGAAQAASFEWYGSAMYDSTGKAYYSGEATVMAFVNGLTAASATEVTKINLTDTGFYSDPYDWTDAEVGTIYRFYLVLTDGDKVFDGSKVTNYTLISTAKAASTTVTVTIPKAYSAATQNSSNWTAAPEPTSGLLLLVGGALLALRRRRA